MHDSKCQGVEFFKCDFCHRPWADDRPMVEGHQGSLICAACLSVAFAEVVRQESPSVDRVANCTMCLEDRAQPGWRSPAFDDAVICLRCIKQSATALEKDPEIAWERPA